MQYSTKKKTTHTDEYQRIKRERTGISRRLNGRYKRAITLLTLLHVI